MGHTCVYLVNDKDYFIITMMMVHSSGYYVQSYSPGGAGSICRGKGAGGGGRDSFIDTFFLCFAERIFTPFPSHFLYSAPFVVAWICQCFDVLNSSC